MPERSFFLVHEAAESSTVTQLIITLTSRDCVCRRSSQR